MEKLKKKELLPIYGSDIQEARYIGYNEACDDWQKYCEHLEETVCEYSDKQLEFQKAFKEQLDELQAIKEENAKLREALKKIADEAEGVEYYFVELAESALNKGEKG